MNINELESYKLSDAVKFHTELNPMLFNDEHMESDVREKLFEIANEFIDYLGINDLDIDDITLSGSNAAYTYTDHSDIDLHILIDMKKINNDDIYRELFTAKKNLFNDNHDIKIRGYDVELYVQDKNQPVKSLGEYSILNDKWIKFPRKQRASIDQNSVKHKVTKLVQMAEIANRSNDIDQIDKVLSTIKRYRQSGLDKHGEFGPENIAFKILRTNGIIDKLYNHRNRLYSIQLSLDEDWHPNEEPPGPESKPTMPQGTVRVDVSDLYDWYKIGTNISNLDKANPSDFGKGPPSTIMAFGSEEEEHKYINALKRLGLTTTDIDPVDPNQPKGMPRQKTDPTFNVAEDVKHSKNTYLWHGSRHRNEVLIPRQATDTGGAAGSNQNAIYATTDPKIAIAMGLTTSGSDTGMFPNDPQMVLFSGDIRKGQNVYLHKLPMNGLDGKPQFVQGGNSREFHSVPRVKSIKPVEIKEVPVNKYLNLIRRATPQDLELQKKYQNKDVDEGSMKDVYGEIQDEHWDGIVGYVINGLKKGISEERIELYLYKWAGKELFDLDEELEGRGFGSLSELVDHIQEHDGKYVNPTFDLDSLFGDDQEHLSEASGYIPSESEKNDPRFKTALTVDINPNTMKKNAAKFGWKIARNGRPPLLRK